MASSVTSVQESLLALEMDRLYDVFQDNATSDTQREAAVDQAASWFRQLWHDDRLFLQRTALPLVAFRLFQEAMEQSDADLEGPLVVLLRRLSDSGSTDRCKEFFVRLVIVEFRVFVKVLGHVEASVDALSRVIERLASVIGRHDLCVETLNDALVENVKTAPGKKMLLQVVDRTGKLTPRQKVAVFLHACSVETASNLRELAARYLQPLATHISPAASAVPLLDDKSQKVRRAGVSCIFDIGIDVFRDELDERTAAEVIGKMAESVAGATLEKRFAALVRDYFGTASTLDEVCELSMLLDEAGASSHPLMNKTLGRIIGTVLKPSFFQRESATQPYESSSPSYDHEN